ncbi:hypothetical protein QAD02_016367 [Eretmocerus hayati]|uniref:Uncharacterized protein n=1 Tax=Eretmocerus hayati TaxID=131215 RepID=A0ACC2PFP1_9HYME|nr:hypothetical protein QAD02_016367 [Eretmocerus hayati]
MQHLSKFRSICGSILVLTFFVHVTLAGGTSSTLKRPHIIFILADDMGWTDVSFHGSDQIPTPNIDALAYNGVILNRHYTLPMCTPSRTALMTGRYPIRFGMQGFPLRAGEARSIPLNVTLMPKHLKKLGYDTNLIGKWHLGYFTKEHTPSYRGFDHFYGYYSGFITYFSHLIKEPFVEDPTKAFTGYDLHRDQGTSFRVPFDSGYFTELITKEAEDVIKKNGNKKPLFLEISHLAPHAGGVEDPLEVPDLSETNRTFSYVKDLNRRKYAGMMKALDESVGRVVKALKDNQMLENSIIVFMADNGAPTFGLYSNTGSNYPLRGIKNTLFEGAVRSAACMFSPLIQSSSRLSEQPLHLVDWLPTIYSVAGGDIADLGEIDGLDQWSALSSGSESPRKSMLVNINEADRVEGAIIGKHKLIKGASSATDGFYGEIGNDPSYPFYRIEDALSSDAGSAIRKLRGFDSVSKSEVQLLRKNATVNCGKRIRTSCSEICLFDIESDPCETENLAKQYPEIVAKLESYIDKYRVHLVNQKPPHVDLCADPKSFNGTFLPWKVDPGEPSRITSDGCRIPVYE